MRVGCRQLQFSFNMNLRDIVVVDLAPKDVVHEWLKYLRDEFPTIAFKSNTQSQRHHLGGSSKVTLSSDILTTSSECIGADTLIKLLKNYCRNGEIKTAITVGVVGFPNVSFHYD